jgi:hypothetical protein
MCGKSAVNSNIVDGCITPDDIAKHFADKYQDLYTSVAYNEDEMTAIITELNSLIADFGFDANSVISQSDVAFAVSKLKPNKNDGNQGLSSNHIKLGGNELIVHISFLLTGILTHGCVPDDFLVSTVIPIPKGRNVNLTDSANYRGISLSSLFGKMFDLIVLSRYSDSLITSDLQFGFKAKRSTNMCSLVLKECISYYNSNHSTVYCTMLDATKAFDRVEYCKLFRKLVARKMPPIVIRLLLNMYINHTTRVAWNGIFSDRFVAKNGVKQGGILSPVLFCIYFDDLISELTKANIGCFIGNLFVGILAYADDVVLLAPTPHAMRKMLAVCDAYANEFNVCFNASKSKSLIVRPHLLSKTGPNPDFYIGGKLIEIVDRWPHLGHIITNTLSDLDDVRNRRNSLVGQINNVLCYFGTLDCTTKVKLLKSYCSSFYGCELWDMWDGGIETFGIAWRRGQRAVWKLPYNTHRRFLPLICDTIPIEDEICRRFLNFLHTCAGCDNELVKFIVRHGINYGGMFSLCGRNSLFCAKRYCCYQGDFLMHNFSSNIVKIHYYDNISAVDLSTVSLLMELTFVRDNIFSLTGISKNTINELISFVAQM